jgi:outer membrane immunogenic protein
MKKLLLGSFVALTMGGSAAIAADMPLKAPPPVVWSWTGCYVGIEGGGAWGRSRHDSTAIAPIGGLAPQFTPWFDISGGLAGGEYGCNQQFGGNWVFGVEGDFSWSGKKGSSADTGPFGNPTFTSTTKEKWLSTTRARIGWTWDRTWLYVTGGLASARVEADVAIPGVGTFADFHVLYGWTVGAGIEYAFWNNWSLKGEYLYVRLENQAFLFPGTPVVPRGALNVDNHIFRVGLNWRYTDCVFWSCGGAVVAKY